MTPLETAGGGGDIGSILAGVAAIIAAIGAVISARKSSQAARQTNGALSGPLAAILDGQRSLGHQVGELRDDLGRMDERLTTDVRDVRRRLDAL